MFAQTSSRKERPARRRSMLASALAAVATFTLLVPAAAQAETTEEMWGAPKRWESGAAAGQYSVVNLRTGRVLTTLPIVGWGGRGPAVSFSLYHNQSSTCSEFRWSVSPGSSTLLQGDANRDGLVSQDDLEPFIEVVLDEDPSAEDVAICDLDGNESVDNTDLEEFVSILSNSSSGPVWSHSYSMHLLFDGADIVLVGDDNSRTVFTNLGLGLGYEAPAGMWLTLVEDPAPADGYTILTKSQYIYHFLSDGKLDFIQDPTGNQLTCTYIDDALNPADGKLDYVLDAAGRYLQLSYNVNGELSRIVDPIARVWTLLYYDSANPTTPGEDATGPFVVLAHPEDNPEPGQTIDPKDYRIGWDYNGAWDIVSMTNKNGETWEFEYLLGRLTKVKTPAVNSVQYEENYGWFFQGSNYRTNYTDVRGNTWATLFNGTSNNLIWWQDPLGYEQSLAYTSSDPNLLHEATVYTNALNHSWGFTYDSAGNAMTVTNPLSQTVTYTYDALNNLTSVTPPSGAAKQVTYAYTDPNCPTSPTSISIPADGQGNGPADVQLSYYYSATEPYANGLLETVLGPDFDPNQGGVRVGTKYEYDEYGQRWRTTEGALDQSSWTKVRRAVMLDEVGRVIGDMHAYGKDYPIVVEEGGSGSRECHVNTGCIKLNFLGLKLTIGCCCKPVFPVGTRPQWKPGEYDEGTTTEAETFTSAFACGRFSPFSPPRGPATFTYTPMGQPTSSSSSFTDTSLFASITFDTSSTVSYDTLGRVTAAGTMLNEPSYRAWKTDTSNPGFVGGSITRDFSYDYNITAGTVTRTGPDGQTTLIETDSAGRVTHVTRGSLSVSYTYYANGQVATETRGDGSVVSYQYDNAGRKTQILAQWATPPTEIILRLDYVYDQDGLVDLIYEYNTSGQVAVTDFTYDNRNRLIEEERIGTPQYPGQETYPYHLSYTYDQMGNRLIKQDHLADIYTEYEYDVDAGSGELSRNNRLMEYRTYDTSGVGDPVLVETVTYEYDSDGRVAYIVRYDPTVPVTGFGYHSTTLQYNHSGELWFVTEQKWTQEEQEDGAPTELRVTRMTEFRGSGRQRYMRRQRMASADGPWSSEEGEENDYWWGGDLGYVETGSTIWSDYDGDTIYGDYQVVFTEDSPYNWSKEVVEKTAYMPGLGQYDHASDTAVYFVTDIVGTTQSISHGGGVSVRHGQRIVQTAFGERVHAEYPNDVGTRYQFAGAFGYETFPAWDDDAVIDAAGAYATDEDMPFVHVGYRYYCPETGRFLQSDPIGIRGGMNTYAYCGNNPMGGADPNGHYEVTFPYTPEWLRDFEEDLARMRIRQLEEDLRELQEQVNQLQDNQERLLKHQKEMGDILVEIWDNTRPKDRYYIINEVGLSTCVGSSKVRQQIPVNDEVLDPEGVRREPNPNRRTCQDNPVAPTCFLAGTLVWTLEGMKSIESIGVGDVVVTAEDGAPLEAEVIALISGRARELVVLEVAGDTITCTPEHPLYVMGCGWTAACDVLTGDALQTQEGQPVYVRSVRSFEPSSYENVYTLSVSYPNSFCVGTRRVIVHNKLVGY